MGSRITPACCSMAAPSEAAVARGRLDLNIQTSAKRQYLNANAADRPLRSPIPQETLESARSYRLARLRQQLHAHDCAAVLLYDPVNIRYALDAPNMQVWTLHNAYRYALVFAAGPAVMFEFGRAEHVLQGLKNIDEIRPSIAWNYMAPAQNA